MSDPLRLVRNESVVVERMLTSLGGSGNGLGEKGRSLENQLPQKTLSDLKQIAAMRNRVMHDGYEPSEKDMRQFLSQTHAVKAVLNDLGVHESGQPMNHEEYKVHQAREETNAAQLKLDSEKGIHNLTRAYGYIVFIPICYSLINGRVFEIWQNQLGFGLFGTILTILSILGLFLNERAYFTTEDPQQKLKILNRYIPFGFIYWPTMIFLALAIMSDNS